MMLKNYLAKLVSLDTPQVIFLTIVAKNDAEAHDLIESACEKISLDLIENEQHHYYEAQWFEEIKI